MMFVRVDKKNCEKLRTPDFMNLWYFVKIQRIEGIFDILIEFCQHLFMFFILLNASSKNVKYELSE